MKLRTSGEGGRRSICSPSLASGDGAAEALAGAVRRQLAESQYGEVRSVDCQHQGGALILRGRVSSYFQKQMALVAALQAAPDARVCDEVEVQREP
ncbi:MAG: hypothetical protein JNG90_17670 [Planctomycetaceae bacterium]|nr:hypothetical protein [Planctomycetaceae bacterium]